MESLMLKIKRLTSTAKLPTKAHPDDACYDLYADLTESVLIYPHSTRLIPTGISTSIPHRYWGAVFARSGLATKKNLRPAQGVPVIDENYRGEWKVPMHNEGNIPQFVEPHERIAQFTLLPYPEIIVEEVQELDSTDRGEGGFGSTGST